MRGIFDKRIQDPVDAFQINGVIREMKAVLREAPILWGFGSPEGSVKAGLGWMYLNLRGGTNETLYVKESGDGTDTGWIAK